MANETHCDKCGAFLRDDGGCTHCERAALLSGPVRSVGIGDAETILSEPVEVRDRNGRTVVFRKEKLLGAGTHAKDDHAPADYRRRCHRILFAIDAARNGRSRTELHQGRDGIFRERTKYRKDYAAKGDRPAFRAIVFADAKGNIREVFTFSVD
ncbi:MAG: hypothetical protein IJ678_06815 [Kiritimatiellae bacterium]|nr:hypothetical protein [Kiritimatiellia bacterium]